MRKCFFFLIFVFFWFTWDLIVSGTQGQLFSWRLEETSLLCMYTVSQKHVTTFSTISWTNCTFITIVGLWHIYCQEHRPSTHVFIFATRPILFVHLLYLGKLSRPKCLLKLNKIIKISQEDGIQIKNLYVRGSERYGARMLLHEFPD